MELKWSSMAAILLCASVLGPGRAFACSGGQLVRGGYGMVLFGTSAQGQPEALAGAIDSTGKCSFTGHFYGNVNGVAITDAAATGSYSINSDYTGTLTLSVAGAPSLSFAINWVIRHRQVTGLETDSIGQIDAREQQQSNYTLASLSKSYSYLCSGTDNQPALLLSVLYNGAGSATYSGLQYVSGGITEIPGSSTAYTVNTDGTYTLPIVDGNGNDLVFGGEIDSEAYNAPMAAVMANGSPMITGPLHCVGQQQ